MTERSHTDRLAQFGAALRAGILPESTVASTKDLIRDTLGCIVAGRSAESSRSLAQVIEAFAGTPEATVLASGLKLPVPAATYLNAHAGNALDADDTVLYKAHIGAAVVPAALAIAERHRRSGAEFIAAVALGYEVAGRIGLSLEALMVGEDGRFRFGPVTGYSWVGIGAAVAAGRLLELDAGKMHQAIGIAAATIPLPGAARFGAALPRPMTKYAMYGAIAQAGVLAALFAGAGFTAERDVLDGDKGLWRIAGSLGCRFEALTDRLGERWIIEQASYKIYPACRFISSSLDNFLALVREHAIGAEEIDRVVARVPEAGLAKLKVGEPRVESLVDAGFSLPFMLGMAAFGGPPGPDWLSPRWRTSAEVRALAARVSVEVEPSAAAIIAEDLRRQGYAERMPCSLEIAARGATYSTRCDYARGDSHPSYRLTSSEHELKFRTFCRPALGAAEIDAAIAALDSLERQSTLDPLLAALAGRAAAGDQLIRAE